MKRWAILGALLLLAVEPATITDTAPLLRPERAAVDVGIYLSAAPPPQAVRVLELPADADLSRVPVIDVPGIDRRFNP